MGQLFNVIGSTDVLALCTDLPVPHERLLTRGLGIGRRWLSVSTIAAAASSLYWAKVQFFPDWNLVQFRRAMAGLAARGSEAAGDVRFDPHLAGDRTSVEQRRGAFTGLTLATTREQMLAAIIESLATAGAAPAAVARRGQGQGAPLGRGLRRRRRPPRPPHAPRLARPVDVPADHGSDVAGAGGDGAERGVRASVFFEVGVLRV